MGFTPSKPETRDRSDERVIVTKWLTKLFKLSPVGEVAESEAAGQETHIDNGLEHVHQPGVWAHQVKLKKRRALQHRMTAWHRQLFTHNGFI